MKFNEICQLVLESDYDTLTGKSKVFSLSEDAEEKVLKFSLNDAKDLIKKTTLPFTTKYLTSLIMNDLMNYLPAETTDLKRMLKRNIWITFDESEKKSTRAANILFAFLKKRKLIIAGIPKRDDKEDIENLARELDKDIADKDYIRFISKRDTEKLGGMLPRSTGHAEDENEREWF